MTDYRKKLIEVALPLEAINEASAYDKMPGIGPHPKGLHKWWAPLPLPCARAVLFASMLDDPSSSPELFCTAESQANERARLLRLLEAAIDSRSADYATAVVQARQEIRSACGEAIPTLLDPFCGSGAIPLEGVRLGLPVRASDLNPVAVLMNKCEIDVPRRFVGIGPVSPDASRRMAVGVAGADFSGLAEDVKFYARVINERIVARLKPMYSTSRVPAQPKSGPEIVAWIWARTVQCPNPACGVKVPLARTFQLANKGGQATWIEPCLAGGDREFTFRVRNDGHAPSAGTVSRTGGKCLVS